MIADGWFRWFRSFRSLQGWDRNFGYVLSFQLFKEELPMRAVILAGGKGTRLRPYTTVFPKPLMPIGDEPILKVVLSQLKNAGKSTLLTKLTKMPGLVERPE